jgi:hypothetical protein
MKKMLIVGLLAGFFATASVAETTGHAIKRDLREAKVAVKKTTKKVVRKTKAKAKAVKRALLT